MKYSFMKRMSKVAFAFILLFLVSFNSKADFFVNSVVEVVAVFLIVVTLMAISSDVLVVVIVKFSIELTAAMK